MIRWHAIYYVSEGTGSTLKDSEVRYTLSKKKHKENAQLLYGYGGRGKVKKENKFVMEEKIKW